MVANRDLLVPKPPGSMLTESPYERATKILGKEGEGDSKQSLIMLLSATQIYSPADVGLDRQNCQGLRWDICLQTLQGHSNYIKLIVFSHNSV